MNLYIWRYCENVTDNYHSGGGLMVQAATLDEARALITRDVETDSCNNGGRCDALDEPPTWEIELAPGGADLPDVVVFRDAGCC